MTTGVVELLSLSLSSSNLFFFIHIQVTHVGGWLGGLVNTDLEKKRGTFSTYICIYLFYYYYYYFLERCDAYIFRLCAVHLCLSFNFYFLTTRCVCVCVCLCAALLTSSIIKRRQKLYLFFFLWKIAQGLFWHLKNRVKMDRNNGIELLEIVETNPPNKNIYKERKSSFAWESYFMTLVSLSLYF
jgi:hypothetical protein